MMRRKHILQAAGLPAVYVGVAALCLARLLPTSLTNAANITAWLVIVGGAVCYVIGQKL